MPRIELIEQLVVVLTNSTPCARLNDPSYLQSLSAMSDQWPACSPGSRLVVRHCRELHVAVIYHMGYAGAAVLLSAWLCIEARRFVAREES